MPSWHCNNVVFVQLPLLLWLRYPCQARMINGVVRTRVSESLRWRDISYTLDRACSRQPWVHTISCLCLCRIVMILCLFSCLCCYDCGIHVRQGWSMELFGLEFPRVFDDATSLTLLTEPVHANHEFILYLVYVFAALWWYCVCSVAFAATIAVSIWRGWSMELFGLEFPRVFDDATSLTLLTEPVHANHEFILYLVYVFVTLWWYCVCSVAFAATIAVSMSGKDDQWSCSD